MSVKNKLLDLTIVDGRGYMFDIVHANMENLKLVKFSAVQINL